MAEAGEETELKFLCEPADLAAVLAAAPVGADQDHELISVYFDTPDARLARAGASLRVRRTGAQAIQTLKQGQGLSREEHESPVEGETPDLTTPSLQALLTPRERASLRPAFGVTVRRRTRRLILEGAEIELALDQGEVRGGDQAAPVCEVELELVSGPPQALFALARSLGQAAPLYLSFRGKADRGQALISAESGAKVRAVRLERRATLGQAVQAIGRQALGEIADQGAILRQGASPEAVHRLRVATRRLRAALGVFKPILDTPARAEVIGELKWLAGACDEARDLDVFALGLSASSSESPDLGLADLAQVVEAARERAHARVAASVGSARFRALMLDATAWLETGAWLTTGDGAKARAADIVPDLLTRRRRRLRKSGAALAELDDAARHRVRVQAKSLRYAVEALAPLLAEPGAKRLIKRLKTLHERLGVLSDAATAEKVIAGLRLDGPALFAAGRLLGARIADRPAAIAAAVRAMERVSDAPKLRRR